MQTVRSLRCGVFVGAQWEENGGKQGFQWEYSGNELPLKGELDAKKPDRVGRAFHLSL
jgi:hypothetical protein